MHGNGQDSRGQANPLSKQMRAVDGDRGEQTPQDVGWVTERPVQLMLPTLRQPLLGPRTSLVSSCSLHPLPPTSVSSRPSWSLQPAEGGSIPDFHTGTRAPKNGAGPRDGEFGPSKAEGFSVPCGESAHWAQLPVLLRPELPPAPAAPPGPGRQRHTLPSRAGKECSPQTPASPSCEIGAFSRANEHVSNTVNISNHGQVCFDRSGASRGSGAPLISLRFEVPGPPLISAGFEIWAF